MAPSRDTPESSESSETNARARWTEEMGKRPVKVANCSGYAGMWRLRLLFRTKLKYMKLTTARRSKLANVKASYRGRC